MFKNYSAGWQIFVFICITYHSIYINQVITSPVIILYQALSGEDAGGSQFL